jgi:tyrosine-specific transport protein
MKIIYAIATLSGTIIGAGLFALPYITFKLGFWVILAYFLVLGSFIVLIHLFFGELALKTPDFKRLPGFAKIYLGRRGQVIAYVSTILSLFGALLAYLILGGEFLAELLQPVFGGGELPYTVFYFIMAAAVIFHGIKAVAKVEFWGFILFFVILSAIFFRGESLINADNLFNAPDWSLLFLPYGVILFSLWGATLIPEIEEMLGERKKAILKIIPIAILIPAFIYLFFIYLILGITGPQTTESALAGLREVLGDGIVSLALIFGLLTTFTSFITLGLTLKKVFWYDLKFKRILSWAITCFLPLSLYLAGVKSFIAVIGVVGGMMLAVDGILILLMYKKVRPERKILVYPLILLLLGGIIYSVIYFS